MAAATTVGNKSVNNHVCVSYSNQIQTHTTHIHADQARWTWTKEGCSVMCWGCGCVCGTHCTYKGPLKSRFKDSHQSRRFQFTWGLVWHTLYRRVLPDFPSPRRAPLAEAATIYPHRGVITSQAFFSFPATLSNNV